MRPKPRRTTSEQPVIGWKLDLALDPNHELTRLAVVIPWEDLTKEFGRLYVPDLGRPGIPVRLMAGLHLLKHIYGLSDEQVVKGWVENPCWQHFCGEEFFQHHFPINPSQMTRWRKRVGEKGVEKLLEATITAGKSTGTITDQSFEKVIVDTTVQPKAIQHPTDARLYLKVHRAMLKIAEAEGIKLRQSYRKLMEWGFRKHGGHAKARQFKRARKVLRSLKTMAGRVQRDVERKLTGEGYSRHRGALILSELILTQARKTKGKVYSLRAPEVECIGKGKAHRPYEFGVKASLAVTHREGFVVGAMSCPGNPFDGHTLEGQLDQVERITGQIPTMTFVDKGYQGHGVDPARSQVLISGTRKLSKVLKRDLRRRAAIEPELGHMKADGLLGRNFLRGVLGDMQNVILCGAGHNIRKILAHLRALLRLLTGEARKAVSALIAFLKPQARPRPLPISA